MKNVIVGKKSANRLVKKKAKHAVVCGSVKTTLFFSNLQHSVWFVWRSPSVCQHVILHNARVVSDVYVNKHSRPSQRYYCFEFLRHDALHYGLLGNFSAGLVQIAA